MVSRATLPFSSTASTSSRYRLLKAILPSSPSISSRSTTSWLSPTSSERADISTLGGSVSAAAGIRCIRMMLLPSLAKIEAVRAARSTVGRSMTALVV